MRKSSKIIALLLVLCMVVAINTAAPAYADEGAYDLTGCDPVKIVFPITNAPEYLETKCTEKWMDLVTERSNGLITFDYTNGGALGTQMELLEGIEYGTYDLSIIDLANFSEFVPAAKVLGMPCLIKNYDHADKIFSGEVFEWLQKIMEENSNIMVLNTYYCGFRYVFSNKDVSTLEKCKGILIRSQGVISRNLYGILKPLKKDAAVIKPRIRLLPVHQLFGIGHSGPKGRADGLVA